MFVYILVLSVLLFFSIDSMLFNGQANEDNTEKVVGEATVIKVIEKTGSGTYPRIIFDINEEEYVLYWRSNLNLKSKGYSEVSELIEQEKILEFTVKEQRNLFPSVYGELKTIVDIRSEDTVYVDIDDVNSDAKREIFNTIMVSVFLFICFLCVFLLKVIAII